ncbi:unnamed protein product [Trichobilharzia szidati]|nr:unnamed protein product [Trichobilharzia szidati]
MTTNSQQRHLLQRLLFVLIFQCVFQSIQSLSSNELCLNKTCSGCIAGSLSCQEGGLTRLPDRLSSDIQSMILMSHKFYNPVLTNDNFSMYAQQNVKLQRLTLRNCGIQSIQPSTFQSLKSLQQLDLSQNRIKLIAKGTFQGLHLDFLRLDENFGLNIEMGAFESASIVSLSINQCGLKTITYDTLLPLINSKQLKNLHLSGNQLMTLESRLEPIFLQLQSLSLEQNPFNCDCKLSWLASVLNRRQVQRRTRGLLMFNDDDDHDDDQTGRNSLNRPNNLVEFNQHNTPLDGDLLKPLCHHPRRLVGRSIESLTVSDFFCGTPKLQVVEIDLGQLTEFYKGQTDQKKQVSGNQEDGSDTSLTVTVRCHVKGSPELHIDWYRPVGNGSDSKNGHSPNSQSSFLTLMQNHQQQQFFSVPNTKLLPNGGIELKLSQQIRPNSESQVKGSNNPYVSSSKVEKLICFASDSNGNTSAEIVFHWPTFEHLQAMSNSVLTSQTNKAKAQKNKDKETGDSILQTDKNSITNDRSLASYEMTHGWYTVLQDDPENMLFQKQFSVLEMIGAVVGTFTVTLTFFIFGCCLLKFHRRNRCKARSKILLHHTTSENSYRNFSPASENLKSPPYSVTNNHLVNSSTTHNNNNTSNNNASYSISTVPNTLMNSYTTSNFLTGNGTLVNDFNGMKHLPFTTTTYEPINSTCDFQTSTGYSDSQTYDLPQIHPTHSPPSIPLPPLPNGFINTVGGVSRANEKDQGGAYTHENNHAPMLITTSPYITTSPSVNDVNRCADASLLSPLLMNDTRNLSAAISAAATLNLHMKQQQQRQQNSQNQYFNTAQNHPYTHNPVNPDNMLTQNQLLDLITRQNLLTRQLHDTQQQQQQQ